MKRAPAGARSTGLKYGAFVPDQTGFRVEMPGGSSWVNTKSGKLEEDILFEAKRMAPIAKVLSTYLGQEEKVTVVVSENEIAFQCGTSLLRLSRKG